MPFIDCAGVPANCIAIERGPIRTTASRLWHGDCRPAAALRVAGERAAHRMTCAVGRVDSAGAFEDAEITRELSAALPDVFVHALSPRMDWYGCRGAHFHNDAHFEDVLFGVWCVAGPDRELVLPRVACYVPAGVGSIVVFDPFEPHAVLDRGVDRYRREDYDGSAPSIFLGFELRLTATMREAFGVTDPVSRTDWTLSSRVPVHAETGALPARS